VYQIGENEKLKKERN